MSKSPNEDEISEEEMMSRMPPWMRVLMNFLLIPLMNGFCFVEGFFRTRWEIVPLQELPAAKERWRSSCMTPDQVRDTIAQGYSFLCSVCHKELKTEKQEAEELFPNVWEIRKFARCESCAADREHHSRFHHGYMLFRQDDQWMAIVPCVPFLRRCWLWLWR